MTLTEKWKKGELEAGYYYVKNEFGNIFAADYSEEYDHINDVVVKDFWTEVSEIIEVLALVPSYEEWQQLHKFLEEFNALDVAKENQRLQMSLRMTVDDYKNVVDICEQLKELLKECKDVLLSYSNISGDYELYDKITNAIGDSDGKK